MAGTLDGQTLTLPATLGLNEAGSLHGQLLSLRGKPLTIDASAVTRTGTQPVQVLVSAARTWQADGQPLTFIFSDAFQKTLQLIGLGTEHLQLKETM